MSFANAEALNAHLRDRSYVEGYAPSQADYAAFAKLSAAEAAKFPYVSRWYNHIAFVLGSLATRYDKQSAKAVNLAEIKTAAAPAPAAAPAKAAETKAAANDDDDFNLDDDDDEENQAIIEAAKKKREDDAKKGKVPVIAKSTVILDVKPVGLETDLAELEKKIRAIEMEGLLWGSAELKPVAFGVKLIRIIAIIVDSLVSVDDLQDKIQAFEDDVQSTDIFAFNKL